MERPITGQQLYSQYAETSGEASFGWESLTPNERKGWDGLALKVATRISDAAAFKTGRAIGFLLVIGMLTYAQSREAMARVKNGEHLRDPKGSEAVPEETPPAETPTGLFANITPEQDAALRTVARELNSPESFLGGPCLVVGKVYRLPESEQLIRVTGGSYLGGEYPGEERGVSNFWYWEIVDEQHRPTGAKGHGYGWTAEPVEPKK